MGWRVDGLSSLSMFPPKRRHVQSNFHDREILRVCSPIPYHVDRVLMDDSRMPPLVKIERAYSWPLWMKYGTTSF